MSQKSLSEMDLFSPFVKEAQNLGFSAEVYADYLPEGRKAIGTHSGSFHSDESLSVSMLRLLPEYANHVVVRTRNPDLLSKCDIVVDVGGEYNPENQRYDHHQKSFSETYDEKHKTKLSSAGLIMKHFGERIVRRLLRQECDDETVQLIKNKVYDNFVEEIDGNDNGINAGSGEANYKVSTTISKKVARLNVNWDANYTTDMECEHFRLAMGLMLGELVDHFHEIVDVDLPLREVVQKGMLESKTGAIVVIEKECDFSAALYDLEETMHREGKTRFVVYPSKGGDWRVRGINTSLQSFDLRQKVLPQWTGLRGEELSKACGITGCIFVHATGFIGSNETKEGAIAMAEMSLCCVCSINTCTLYLEKDRETESNGGYIALSHHIEYSKDQRRGNSPTVRKSYTLVPSLMMVPWFITHHMNPIRKLSPRIVGAYPF